MLQDSNCSELIKLIFACPLQLTVTQDGEQQMGTACHLILECRPCGITFSEGKTSRRSGAAFTGFDINRRLVMAAAVNGIGFTQLCRFFGLLNMPPPMHLKTWQHYQVKLFLGASRAASHHLQEAAEIVRAAYADLGVTPDAEGYINIIVSFDGSWQRRGRCSHNGIATVICVVTGLVLDFTTLSNYCHACELGPEPGSPQFDAWWAKHEAKCQKNVNCSSAAMETQAAVIMFSRSAQLHKFRYTKMLSDGDAKAHAAVLAVDPYGEHKVEKEECVNHVTKRMGTALRTLLEKSKAQGKPLGGRGKLTDERVKKLTNYYGRAIKDHAGNLDAMEQAVWASFFHTLSTDEDPHHLRCPKGLVSWCFFQRDLANGVVPRPHPHPLPRFIGNELVPVYKRLGDRQLLQKCLSGKTQNSNESFHAMVWQSCPKERWACLRTVDTAVAVCVQRFNKGSSSLLDVLSELDLVAGKFADTFSEKADLTRAKTSSRMNSNAAKQRRKVIDNVRRQERANRRGQEGVVYAPGNF